MEELSEQDRFEHGVIPHDLVLNLGELALQPPIEKEE